MTEPRVDRNTLACVYGGGADAYDRMWSPVILPAAIAVVDAMELADATRVLDVGAGTGALTSSLRTAAPDGAILSVDRSAAMLRHAVDHRNADAVVADAATLPFSNASVDAVLLAFVLFHLLHPAAGVGEAARVLRPSGTLGTVTFASETPPLAITVWNEVLDEFDVPVLPAGQNHSGLDTTDAIALLLDAAGLRPIEVWVHEIEHTFTPDELWLSRTEGGTGRARLSTLAPVAREAPLREARRRLDQLSPSDYTFRASVVCSVSRKAV